jgi:hypothetical protein
LRDQLGQFAFVEWIVTLPNPAANILPRRKRRERAEDHSNR